MRSSADKNDLTFTDQLCSMICYPFSEVKFVVYRIERSLIIYNRSKK